MIKKLIPMLLIPLTIPIVTAQGEKLRTGDLDLSVPGSEPDITITEHDNRTMREYRINNNVYMIKVTPRIGAPYYLVDPDGTGNMEWRRNSLGMDVNPPRWALFSW